MFYIVIGHIIRMSESVTFIQYKTITKTALKFITKTFSHRTQWTFLLKDTTLNNHIYKQLNKYSSKHNTTLLELELRRAIC